MTDEQTDEQTFAIVESLLRLKTKICEQIAEMGRINPSTAA